MAPYLFYVVEHIHNILRQKSKKVAKNLKYWDPQCRWGYT
jgi:hypothetical protein